MNLPQVRPIEPRDVPALKAAAAADDHIVVSPTHVVEKDGKIVGYASLQPCVMINTWLDSKTLGPRESFHLLNIGENLARGLTGQRTIVMPCAEHSPFHPLLDKLGYTRFGQTTLNVKG